MATISITIPDEVVPRVVAALRDKYPGSDSLTDVQLAKMAIRDNLRAITESYEVRLATDSAATTYTNALAVARQAVIDATSGIT